MANKTLLVAQREYLENVRTKTFWIGILAFPVILVLSIGAGVVLQKLKQVKAYAVLDLSDEGYGEKIERAVRTPDTPGLLKLMRNANLPARLSELKGRFADRIAPAADGQDQEMPDELRRELQRAMLEIPATDFQALIEQTSSVAKVQKFERRELEELDLAGLGPDEQRARLRQLVESEALFAFFEIGADPIGSLDGFCYVSNNLTDSDLRQAYENAATRVVQKARIEQAGIDPKLARSLQETVRFREQKIGKDGAAEDVKAGDKANKYAPVGFVYLLWIAVFTAAQMLLTNTVEEKSNRIIEVLLSSVSPLQLMAG